MFYHGIFILFTLLNLVARINDGKNKAGHVYSDSFYYSL